MPVQSGNTLEADVSVQHVIGSAVDVSGYLSITDTEATQPAGDYWYSSTLNYTTGSFVEDGTTFTISTPDTGLYWMEDLEAHRFLVLAILRQLLPEMDYLEELLLVVPLSQ